MVMVTGVTKPIKKWPDRVGCMSAMPEADGPFGVRDQSGCLIRVIGASWGKESTTRLCVRSRSIMIGPVQ
jgi:hypothetical protein